MKRRSVSAALAWLAALGITAAAARGVAAQAPPLRVLASNGMKAVVDALEPQLARAAGRELAIEFGTTAGIRQRIEGGESFDVTILAADAIAALAASGKLAAGTTEPLGRAGVGIGVRAGAPKLDVRTTDSLARALRAAKSVTWVGVGAARPHIERMAATVGITDELRPKTVLASSVEEAVDNVASGKADVLITLVSEILPAHGVDFAGPLPSEVQGYVSFGAGVGAASSARMAGVAFIAALRAPATAATYAAKGMELGAANR
jgi:molybdate transport system substrate-binding protein